MIILAQSGHPVSHMARLVLRSEDTVARVLKRFLAGGLNAVGRRTSPGRGRTITSAWEAELLRVIELDPHEVGRETANWTRRFARRLPGEAYGGEGHARNSARLLARAWLWRPRDRPGREGAKPKRKRTTWEKTTGRGVGSREPQHLNLCPLSRESKLICGSSFPPICRPCSSCSRAQISLCKMRCNSPFTRR
jgi:hypothetical protein